MKQLIITLAAIVLSISLYAQSPEGFKYQAVVRDHSGAIIQDQAIGLQVRLRQGSSTGTLIYEERFNPTSNSFGLINVAIGSGVVFLGNFSSIDWSAGPYFVEIGLDLTGGNTYTTMGTNQLLSVPYALYAKTAGNGGINYVAGTGISLSGNTISNTAPDKTVTILGNGATTVTGTYPNFTINSTDQVNDADADATNEIQNLSLSGTILSITDGNSVDISGATSSPWKETGMDIYYDEGRVAIGKNTVHPSAILEISSANKGLLIPRMNEMQKLSLGDPAVGLLIYQTNESEGFYYYDGTGWVQLNDASSALTKINDLSDGKSDANGSSLFLGIDAGLNDDGSDNQNIGVGLEAMKANTTGSQNTATGYQALYSNTTGSSNTANGFEALRANTTGSSNTATGYRALRANTTGRSNTANGFEALRLNTTGGWNTATGVGALRLNTTGDFNTANGYRALYSNTTGDFNSANGYRALYSNTTGSQNTATGRAALFANTTGFSNTATGVESLGFNTTGNRNTANGYRALFANTTGHRNTATGVEALRLNTTGAQNSATGYRALRANTTGDRNTATGVESLGSNTTGAQNSATGYKSLGSNTTGNRNTATGYETLVSNTTGNNNSANGYRALFANTTGDFNTATGYESLGSNTTGDRNSANGYRALFANTTGYFNTATGVESLLSNTTGNENTANGNGSLRSNTTGDFNTATGVESLNFNTSGNRNSANGYRALYSNTTGENNTAVGIWALEKNTTKSNNTALGYSAFSNNGNSYSNSMGLGYDAEPDGNNVVRIGNGTITTIGGYTNWTNASDGRFKTHIKEDVVGLDFVMKLRPLTYQLDMEAIATFNHTPDSLRLYDAERLKASEIQTGFIAQEVEAAAREVGYNFHGVDKPQNEKSHYGLRYAEFVVPLVKAMQEQQAIIERQQSEIDELKVLVHSLIDK